MNVKRITSLASLKDLLQDGTFELTEVPVVPHLSSFINSDINTSLFVTKFSKEDVGDFCDFLARYPAVKYRDSLEPLLDKELSSWMRLHQGKCPYEPFLWALKLTDNYFGSIMNSVSEPDKSMLEPICNALLKIYKSEYDEIISNILLYWDWYQPVHVAIKLYEMLQTFENEQINTRLREYWLLHFMYTHNAYRCLLHKEMTDANIKSVLFHVCNDTRPGVNGSDVVITKKDRQSFMTMYYTKSKDIRDRIKTLYIDRRQNCPKAVRELFDKELNDISSDSNIKSDIIQSMLAFSQVTDIEDRVQAEMNFQISLWQLMGETRSKNLEQVLNEAPRYGLANCVAETLLDGEFGRNTQFYMLGLLASENREYHAYIEKKYVENRASIIRSDEAMMYASAYCILGHPELVDSIVYAFYVEGYGVNNAQYVFNRIKTTYGQQVDEAVNEIVIECKRDNEKALKVLSNCVKVSRNKKLSIPVAFDSLCDQLVSAALVDSGCGYNYARVVLDLISNIATTNNRQRYYNMLFDLLESKARYLEPIKSKVDDLIHKLWPIA